MIEVTVQLPDEIAQKFGGATGEIPRHILEAVALEGYRSARLTRAQVGELLGFHLGEADAFLAEHQIHPLPGHENGLHSDLDLEAFHAALPQLLETDRGRFVAISNGKIVDRDADEFALVKRVAHQHPEARVRIQRVVQEGLEEFHIDTPEFEFPKEPAV